MTSKDTSNQAEQKGKDKTNAKSTTNDSLQNPSDEMSNYSDHWDAASTTTTSSMLKDYETQASSSRQSSISKAVDSVKSRLSRGSNDDPQAIERARAKAERKQERKEEYERLGLDEKIKFGTRGAGNFGTI